ncbi:unnamed protein product [Coffea canephora]|uniref:Uncharacterized protein n=1 Tax=Coffea canephora TaxID=49390 RepID=A0A068UW31_COFCA|nr:unnamed protein product [Coffea canephora]
MSSSLGKTVSACWRPLSQYVHDPSIWYKDLEKHFCGEFSFAAAQANRVTEDHGQVETGKNVTFVGVYDGHGSHEAARFISDNLFYHLISEWQYLFQLFPFVFEDIL